MSPLEADALPGAGLTPAAERLRNMISVAKVRGNTTVTLTNTFAGSLIELLERAGTTLEAQSDSMARCKNSIRDLLVHCQAADAKDGLLSTATVRRICNEGLVS